MQTFPTQIGYTPLGSSYQSTVVIGRNLDTPWEAIGFGTNGRPDILERLTINLTSPTTSGTLLPRATPGRKGRIEIDVSQLVQIINSNPYAPATGFHFALREVSVCEINDDGDAEERAMMVISSQTYPTGINP